MQVELQEAAKQLADRVRMAARGETIVIFVRTAEGVVRLEAVREPASAPPVPVFGGARGTVTMRDDFDDPLPEFDDYGP